MLIYIYSYLFALIQMLPHERCIFWRWFLWSVCWCCAIAFLYIYDISFFYFQDHFSGSGVVYEIVSNLPKVTKLMLVKDICFMCVSTCVCFHKHLFIYYCWSCVTAYMCFHTHVLFCYCLSSNSRHSQDVAQRKEGIMSCLTCYICKF